jgi:hypothetical protein
MRLLSVFYGTMLPGHFLSLVLSPILIPVILLLLSAFSFSAVLCEEQNSHLFAGYPKQFD